MSETTSGKNLNLTLIGGKETHIRVKTFVNGAEKPLFGMTVLGEVQDIVTGEHLGYIGSYWDTDAPVLVFPALEPEQRCVFTVWATDESGETTVLVDGYVTYDHQQSLLLPTDGSYPERTLNVLLGEQSGVLSWGKTTAAEVAYNHVTELAASISEDIEALEGAKEVVEKLHGEIADAVLIDSEGHWVIGGVDTFKPSQGPKGADGLDADTVKRVEIASVDDLPTDPEHTSGRYIYYTPLGTKASGWFSGTGGADWYDEMTFHINNETYYQPEDYRVDVANEINARSQFVTAHWEDVPESGISRLVVTAKIAGTGGNDISISAETNYGEPVLSGDKLTGGSGGTGFDAYVWGEAITGEEAWINVGSPSDVKFASESVYGIVRLSSDIVAAEGAGIHRDTNGKIRVDDATATRKGAVRLTALTSDDDMAEECIGATPERTQGGQNLGHGIGVMKATASRYGVTKVTGIVRAADDVVPTANAVVNYTGTTAQDRIDDYVQAAGTTGNALTNLINQLVTEAVTAVTPTPSGTIAMYAGETAPEGWAMCDGSELSRVDNPDLFNAIGLRYGAPSTDSVFKLPNLQGKFVRCVSSNHALGSTQTSAAPNIKGSFYALDNQQVYTGAAFNNGWVTAGGAGGAGYYSYQNIAFDASRVSPVYQEGETEVRPSNIAMNYIIKL